MMDKRTYFLSAVIVAITVPLLLANFYFRTLSKSNPRGDYLSLIEKRNELLMFGDVEFEAIHNTSSIDDFSSQNKLDFIIKNCGNNSIPIEYTISLRDFKLLTDYDPENIKWKLLKYDEGENRYRVVKSSDFEDFENENEKKDIVGRETILNGETHKYMFYYYITDTIKSPVDIKGHLVLE